MPRRGLLSPHKWALLLECTGTLLLAWAGLKSMRLATLSTRGCYLFGRLRARRPSHQQAGTAGSPAGPIFQAATLEVAASIRRTSRLLPRVLPWGLPAMHCLPQALATQWMLARRSIASTLHIGVALGEDGFRSHAWLSCQGRVVIGGVDAPNLYREITRTTTPPVRHKQQVAG